MSASEFDHAFGEWCAPEVTVKTPAHLGRATKLCSEVCAPARFVRTEVAAEIRLGQQFGGSQSIVNALAGHRICKSSRIAEQRPIVTAGGSLIPRLGCQTGNARCVTFRGCVQVCANVFRFVGLFVALPEVNLCAFTLLVVT